MTKLQTLCKLAASATPEQLDAAIDAIKGNRPLVAVGVEKQKNRFAEIIDAHPRCKSDPYLSEISKSWRDHVGTRMSCAKLEMDLDTLESMEINEAFKVVDKAIRNGWYILHPPKSGNGVSPWKAREIEAESLRNHPGNPASASYDRDATTNEMREDFRRRSDALKGMA